MKRFIAFLLAMWPAIALADATVPSLAPATSLSSASTYLAQTGAGNNQLGFMTSIFCLNSGALTVCPSAISGSMLGPGAALSNIGAGSITSPYLAPTGVTPGSYTNLNATIGADGRVTSASNGSGGGGGGISGLTAGQVGIAGSATTLTSSVPTGTSGNSTIIQTNSGGLLLPSILPLATNSAFGAMEGDGTTITCVSGVCSAPTGGAGNVVSPGAGFTVNHLIKASNTAGTGILDGAAFSATPAASTIPETGGGNTLATGFIPAINLAGSGAGGVTGLLPLANLGGAVNGDCVIGSGGAWIAGSCGAGGNATTAMGIAAAGTNQGTATVLTTDWSEVSTVGSGQGVLQETPVNGKSQVVSNNSATTLLVYPVSGGNFDLLSSNVAISVAGGARVILYCFSTTHCDSK